MKRSITETRDNINRIIDDGQFEQEIINHPGIRIIKKSDKKGLVQLKTFEASQLFKAVSEWITTEDEEMFNRYSPLYLYYNFEKNKMYQYSASTPNGEEVCTDETDKGAPENILNIFRKNI